MSARRGAMPLVRLQWHTWVMVAIVVALAVTAGLLLLVEWGR